MKSFWYLRDKMTNWLVMKAISHKVIASCNPSPTDFYLFALIPHLTFFSPSFFSTSWIFLLHPADASAAVLGGPASPLALQVSDINKDYVFLTWQPPSADGASPVDGYYVEKWGIGDLRFLFEVENFSKQCHYKVLAAVYAVRIHFQQQSVWNIKYLLTSDTDENTGSAVF